MNLLRFLFRYSRRMVIWTSLLALLCGAFNAGLLAMINAVLHPGSRTAAYLLWAFIALGAGRLITNFLAQVTLSHFAQDNTARLRRDSWSARFSPFRCGNWRRSGRPACSSP